MRIALVHDWINQIGGAERVLAAFHNMWPDAPIHLLFGESKSVSELLPNAKIIYSPFQKIPNIFRTRRFMAPILPSLIERFDFSAYDVVVSSSVIFSKGIIVRPKTKHISYCYSPTRFLWDRSAGYEYHSIGSAVARHILRMWDFSAAQRPDTFIAVSQTCANRISTYYKRNAFVVPPPIKINNILSGAVRSNFILFVGRLLPHKNVNELILAAKKTRTHLVIVGDGPEKSRLELLSENVGDIIEFRGNVSDQERDELYQTCRAVVVPNEEDWGLTATEAHSHGTPVLALRAGGAQEIVIEGMTGEFFDDSIVESIADGIHRILRSHTIYDPNLIRQHAMQWSEERFAEKMRSIISSQLVGF